MSNAALFISYHAADADAAQRLAQALRDRGLRVCLSREPSLPALTEVKAVAVCLGPHGWDERQKQEVGRSLAWQSQIGQIGRDFPIIPILLPQADLTPAFIFRHAWIDFRHDLTDPIGLTRLVESTCNATAPLRPIAALVDLCPYPGPLPFREEDSAFFFGREALTERLLAEVTTHHLVALVGPPASGKTSLIQAGLLPLLRQKMTADRRPMTARECFASAPLVVQVTPGEQPFHRLAAALSETLSPDLAWPERRALTNRLANQWSAGELGIEQFTAPAERWLLVVDQFEELLTLTPEPARRRFVGLLLQLLAQPNFTLLLALRADFYGEIIRLSPELSRLLEQRFMTVGPLSPAELEQAIIKPARPVTLAFEPGLAERLSSAVAEAPNQLLLLECSLAELWRQHRGGLLRHAFYEQFGRAEGAIAYRAEQCFQVLSAEQQELARQVLARLVRVQPDGQISCRPVSLTELTTNPALDQRRWLPEVLAGLVEAQALRWTDDPFTAEPVLEITHESVMRHWPRWQAWVNEEREFYLWQARLGEAMTGWQRVEPKKQSLLTGSALFEAAGWLARRREKLDADRQVYIWQSLARRDWEGDWRWLLTLALMGLLLVGLVVVLGRQNATFAWLRQERNGAMQAQAQAEATRQAAEIAQTLAEAQSQQIIQQQQDTLAHLLATQAQAMSDNALTQGTLLAIESLRRLPGVAGEQVLHRNLALLGRPLALIRTKEEISALSFSPDGRRLATISSQIAPRQWETRSGGEIVRPGLGEGIPAVSLGRLVGGSAVEPASIGRSGRAVVVSISSDGRWAAAGGGDGWVRIWAIDTGTLVAELRLEEPITTLAFSSIQTDDPQSRWLAVGGWSGQVRLWRLAFASDRTGAEIISDSPALKMEQEIALAAHRDVILALTFSPDGQYLATASADNTARVWHLAAALRADGLIPPALGGGVQEVARLAHRAGVWSVAFSPDGRRLATGSADKTARLWDISSTGGQETARLTHPDDVRLVLFSPNGLWLATVAADYSARVWLATPGSERREAQINHIGRIYAATFSPDSRWLATASADHTARVWEAATGRAIAQMSHNDAVTAVNFNPVIIQGTVHPQLASTSRDGVTRLWEVTPGQEVARFEQSDWLLGVRFSPDGDRLATWSRQMVHVWNMVSRQPLIQTRHDDWISSASFSPEGDWLATASRDKTARLWQTDTGQEIGRLDHPGPVHLVNFSPTGRQLATVSSDNVVRLWQTATTMSTGTAIGPRVIQLPHQRWVNTVVFSPDGRWVITASRDHYARIWNAASGKEVARLSHLDSVLDVAFSPNGQWLATASADHTVRLWNVTTWQEVSRLPHEGRVELALFSPDGRWLATRSGQETWVWEVAAALNNRIAGGEEMARLKHDESVRAVAFSPDGRRLATATGNPPGTGAVRLWETATGREITAIAYDNWISTVAFSPDGRWLVNGGGDRLARVWLLQPPDLMAEACSRLTRNLTRQEWQQYLGQEPYLPTCP